MPGRRTGITPFTRRRSAQQAAIASRPVARDTASVAYPPRILIVAHRTAATPPLLAAVRDRATHGRCEFTLLVPDSSGDADIEDARETLELAIPLLEDAAGGRVEGIIGEADAFAAVRTAHERTPFDEAIVSTLPTNVSRWLRLDLPARVGRLGLPVTVVTPKRADREFFKLA
jgi:hypothetical protein